MREKTFEEFKKLLDIMDELRAKCPWDQQQTNETLRKLTIEETYELADAIIQNNNEDKPVLSGVPASLPATVKANRIQEKVRGVGFDWNSREQIWDKVTEELNELKEEVLEGRKVDIDCLLYTSD